MLAVPADRLPEALGELDPGNRALLDLSLRRGVSDAEIGELLRKDPHDVARGRDAVLELLADALDVAGADRRERVRQAVAALPDDAWRAPQAAPAPAPPPTKERVKPDERPAPPKPREPSPPAVERDDEARREPVPRRSRGGILAALALLAVLGVVLALILGGDDDEGSNESGSQPAPQQADNGTPASGQGSSDRLRPLRGGRGEGRLSVTDDRAIVALRGLPDPDGAYQVWLYDSVVRAKSLGTITEGNGRLEVELPPDAGRYRFLDVSREPADSNPNHSGASVLRAPLRDVLAE